MAYEIKWGSSHPGHLVYLIDLSGSMRFHNKIDDVIDVMESVSEFLVGMCEEFREIRNRFSLTILGYNTNVIELFKGSVIELDSLLEKTVGQGKRLFDKEKDVQPTSMTHTASAFKAAERDIRQWIDVQTKAGKPMPAPIVIHITDGHPEEMHKDDSVAIAEALNAANSLKAVSVPDGNTLLFNIHIVGNNAGSPVRFPSTSPVSLNEKFLYDASSVMTGAFVDRARKLVPSVTTSSRFVVYNETEKNMLARLIAFGSSVSVPSADFNDVIN